MTFNISWIEKKTTKTNKPYLEVTLVDDKGMEHAQVKIWSSHPDFRKITDDNAQVCYGKIKQDRFGKVLEPDLGDGVVVTNFRPASSNFNKTKSKELEKAQERKAESISYFNSCNLALQALGKYVDGPWQSKEEYLEEFLKFRDLFLREFDKWND